jgi:hypothetical protein
VAEIREKGFRRVKPVMNRNIVLRFSAEFAGTALRVLEWMCHRLDLIRCRCVVFKTVIPLHADLERADIEDHVADTAAIVLYPSGTSASKCSCKCVALQSAGSCSPYT